MAGLMDSVQSAITNTGANLRENATQYADRYKAQQEAQGKAAPAPWQRAIWGGDNTMNPSQDLSAAAAGSSGLQQQGQAQQGVMQQQGGQLLQSAGANPYQAQSVMMPGGGGPTRQPTGATPQAQYPTSGAGLDVPGREWLASSGGGMPGQQSIAAQLKAPAQQQAQQQALTANVGGLSLPGQPQSIAGQLGAGPSLQQPGGVAGQLGATPQGEGYWGSVRGQLGGGPGAAYGQAGNLGMNSAQQQGMMGRLEGFLDSPEGPSVAEAQLQQAQAGNMANLMGAARSGRGGAGASAQALRGALSEGSALMSDTAGQMATLRAQEQDMLKNRQLNAIGLGGQMATNIRGQDLTGRAQDIGLLQGDQQTEVATRAQNLGALQGDQAAANQMGIANLQAQMQGRGQDIGALQGDQQTQLAMQQLMGQTGVDVRGQDLQALMSDQGAQLGARGQDVNAMVAGRGQDVTQRGQTLGMMEGDANRALQADQLNLERELGLTGYGLQSQGMGLDYMTQANQQGLTGAANQADFYAQMAALEQAYRAANQRSQDTRYAADQGAPLGFGEQAALAGIQAGGNIISGLLPGGG